MQALKQAVMLARSDLRQELRGFELAATVGFFTLVLTAMFGLSFASLKGRWVPLTVPGMLWISVALTGTLTLTRIFDREREFDTLRALLVAPVSRVAIFVAKAAITLLWTMVSAAILVPMLALMFPGAEILLERWPATLAVLLAGCAGYCGVGTLFAAGLATSSGKNVLLSVIVYPLTTPILLFALVATRALMERAPALWTYVGQMVALDTLLWIVAALLFESVIVGTQPKRQRSSR